MGEGWDERPPRASAAPLAADSTFCEFLAIPDFHTVIPSKEGIQKFAKTRVRQTPNMV